MAVLAPNPVDLYVNSLLIPAWEYKNPGSQVAQQRLANINALLLVGTGGIGKAVTKPEDVLKAYPNFTVPHNCVTPSGYPVPAGSPLPDEGVLNGDGLVIRDALPFTDFAIVDPLNSSNADERWIIALSAPNSVTVVLQTTYINRAIGQNQACLFWGIWNEDTNPQVATVTYASAINGKPKMVYQMQQVIIGDLWDCYHSPVVYNTGDTVAVQVAGLQAVNQKLGFRCMFIERAGLRATGGLV